MSDENPSTGAHESDGLSDEFAKPKVNPEGLFTRARYENPASFVNWKGLPGIRDILRYMFGPVKYPGTPPEEVLNETLPVRTPDFSDTTGLKASWLGHATVLVQMD